MGRPQELSDLEYVKRFIEMIQEGNRVSFNDNIPGKKGEISISVENSCFKEGSDEYFKNTIFAHVKKK